MVEDKGRAQFPVEGSGSRTKAPTRIYLLFRVIRGEEGSFLEFVDKGQAQTHNQAKANAKKYVRGKGLGSGEYAVVSEKSIHRLKV